MTTSQYISIVSNPSNITASAQASALFHKAVARFQSANYRKAGLPCAHCGGQIVKTWCGYQCIQCARELDGGVK